MKNGLIRLNHFATNDNTVASLISFNAFAHFLAEKADADKSRRQYFFKYVLEKIQAYPELLSGVPAADIHQYEEILELVSAIVWPLMEDENESMFGLTTGFAPEVFFASNAFHRLFESGPEISTEDQTWITKENALEMHRHFQYEFVLQKMYGFGMPQKKELLRSFFNPSTGLYKYYRVNIDARFVEVTAMPDAPPVSRHSIDACFQHSNEIFDEIEKLAPLHSYESRGFSIITLTDITEQQVLDQMSKVLISLDKTNAASDFIHFNRLLQTLLGSSQYRFGIIPFITINNRAALLYDNFPFSILLKASSDAGIPRSIFSRYMNHYLQDPKFMVYDAKNNADTLPVRVRQALATAGLDYYALAPIYFNETLVGILETAAPEGVAPLGDVQFSKLKPAIPYIAQLLKLSIDKFNVSIDAVIKDQFTVIQPSVQWKFNEVAWHYFRSREIENKNSNLEKIAFKDVYPLYGAIDIRNSTIERNKALREDLQLQLELLMDLLRDLQSDNDATGTVLTAGTLHWLNRMSSYVSVEEEIELNEFLFNKIHPVLYHCLENNHACKDKAKAYFAAVDEQTGDAFRNRRELENSMRLINKAIGKYFDHFKENLNQYYPCYFEKFRTDGVEYDIYTGQSIAPKRPFTQEDVEKFRRWQVKSMADITKLTDSLVPELQRPLQTTQLIFINARTIDISFRNDERRFDVEGAYNIRYHIIKKRIDKVNILDSSERLTQPGKIAIVYFNERDAEEYIGYIKELQAEKVLLNDLEHMELEELQGVSGLKALRVGVQLNG